MKKRDKLNLFFVAGFCFILIFLYSLTLTSAAEIKKGNLSYDIPLSYSYSEALKGWINITLDNFPSNSTVSYYSQNITLKKLLESSQTIFSCSPRNCDKSYKTSGSGTSTKSLTLSANENKTIGLKINTNNLLESVNLFTFNLSSNAQDSCNPPLKFDIFDDGVIEWAYDKPTTSFCGVVNNGCFSGSTTLSSSSLSRDYPFCGEFSVNQAPGLWVGANLVGTGSVDLEFRVTGSTDDKTCVTVASGSGEVGCSVNLSIIEPTNITVCVIQKNNYQNTYKLYYETNSPCGYYEGASGTVRADFSLVLKKNNYAIPASYSYNDSKNSIISEYISLMLAQNYDSNCSGGCIIPIKIISGQNQNLLIEEMKINFNQIESTNLLYNLLEDSAVINMKNYTRVYLDNSGLRVPLRKGKYTTYLEIAGTTLATLKIEILDLPTAEGLIPTKVPANLNSLFKVLYIGNATSFSWDFGDNSSSNTTTSYVNHKYSTIGNYKVKVSARNSIGETSKIFDVEAISPQTYLNVTIYDSLNKINKLKSQLANLPTDIKNYAAGVLGLNDKETTLVKAKTDFENAGGDTVKYLAIADAVNGLNLPDSLNTSAKSGGAFVLDKTLIDGSSLALVDDKYSSNLEANQDAIYSWVLENLNIHADSSTYSSYYDNVTSPFLSYAKLTFVPRNNIGEVFIIIKSDSAIVSGAEVVKNASGVKIYALKDLITGASREVQITLPQETSIDGLQVYLAPSSEKASVIEGLSVCNYNKKCESSLGENWKNCRNDCKPWLRALWIMIIGFIILLVLYILLQEWYKRHYENYLFKDKNDLYNLIQFIKNAEEKGMKKHEIVDKLRAQGWDNERIEYAYKKYKGMRTGLWEIPIFNLLEKSELDKTLNEKKIKINLNSPPNPLSKNPRDPFPNKTPINTNQIRNKFNPSIRPVQRFGVQQTLNPANNPRISGINNQNSLNSVKNPDIPPGSSNKQEDKSKEEKK